MCVQLVPRHQIVHPIVGLKYRPTYIITIEVIVSGCVKMRAQVTISDNNKITQQKFWPTGLIKCVKVPNKKHCEKKGQKVTPPPTPLCGCLCTFPEFQVKRCGHSDFINNKTTAAVCISRRVLKGKKYHF